MVSREGEEGRGGKEGERKKKEETYGQKRFNETYALAKSRMTRPKVGHYQFPRAT